MFVLRLARLISQLSNKTGSLSRLHAVVPRTGVIFFIAIDQVYKNELDMFESDVSRDKETRAAGSHGYHVLIILDTFLNATADLLNPVISQLRW